MPKDEWKTSLVDKLLDWLKTVLPIAVFSAIIKYFKGKAWNAERKLEEKELEVKHHENKEQVERDSKDKSDRDVVMDAISEGDRIRRNKHGSKSDK